MLIWKIATDDSFMRGYNSSKISISTPTNAQISPQMLYICDATVRFTFVDAPDPQVLNFEIIGEIGGTMVRNV
ncbi:MAG: hypothetical protein EZS28_005664 [Streblomastix strix]|uniref:Uncharacterized protein n=1 Tax=Streblomastix strix TaxID=222440 RepID=A0A5J4WX10_9EUKA|nr:MAG: hypothetical protein EZS28_005664 [Streblomastix strix]